jgi:hypothetical protein
MIKLYTNLLFHRSRYIVESIYRVGSVERLNSIDGDEICLGVLPVRSVTEECDQEEQECHILR